MLGGPCAGFVASTTVSGRVTAAALAAIAAVIETVVFGLTNSRRTTAVIPPRPAVDHTATNAAAVDGFLKCFAKYPEIT